jgi:hypothetical protein
VCPRLNNKTNSQNNKQAAQTTRTRILRNKRTHGPAQRGGMATPHDEKEREYLRRMEAEAAPSRSPPMTRKFGGRGEEESKERTGGAREEEEEGAFFAEKRKARLSLSLLLPKKRTHQTRHYYYTVAIVEKLRDACKSNQESHGLMRPHYRYLDRAAAGDDLECGTRNFCNVFPPDPRDRGEVGTVRHHFIRSFMTQADGNAPATARE